MLSPPSVSNVLISFPTPQILLATLNRPESMNCIARAVHTELNNLWEWYDATPQLRCAIITGAAPRAGMKRARAFSAGADLKEWNTRQTKPQEQALSENNPGGFAGLSTRVGKKPVIAAVHGLCLGGGLEAALNCDMIISHPSSVFGLPEVERGVVPLAGVLPRLVNIVGMPRACSIALAGEKLSASQAQNYGIVNIVTGEGDDVVDKALEVAEKIASVSPDAVVVTRAGLRGAWSGKEINESVRVVEEGLFRKLQEGENMKEGLRAFVEKRKPRWGDSKL